MKRIYAFAIMVLLGAPGLASAETGAKGITANAAMDAGSAAASSITSVPPTVATGASGGL